MIFLPPNSSISARLQRVDSAVAFDRHQSNVVVVSPGHVAPADDVVLLLARYFFQASVRSKSVAVLPITHCFKGIS